MGLLKHTKFNNMDYLTLKQLQACAIDNVMARTSDAYNASIATRIGELTSLHVAAYMKIDETTQSLNKILAYKKELAVQMLECSDETKMCHIGELIKQADNMIFKVLGIYVP
jgi:hypothetical protein